MKLINYGSLYVTLCFVICRFDFRVLTSYFRILSFLLCVLCTMLFILNGAIHRQRQDIDEKTGEKRSCKYFNEFIVPVMYVGYLKFEIHAAGNYHKVKKYTGHATKWVFSLSLSLSLSLFLSLSLCVCVCVCV